MHPLACGLFLLFVGFVAFLGWVAYRTVRSLSSNRAGVFWWLLFGAAILAGGVSASWCALYAEYRPREDLRLLSAPVPAAVLQLEDGNWVDFVGPATVPTVILNWLTVFFGSVVPVSIAYAISQRWLRPPRHDSN